MAKIEIDPDPTFTTVVDIPVPGHKPVQVEFTFRAMDRDELKKLMLEEVAELDPEAMVMRIATGWGFNGEFNLENVTRMVTRRLGAADAIFRKFIHELGQVRLGN